MSADRDDNGRFAKGNPGGPSRPRRAVEADYLAALSQAVPLEKWRDIVETAVDQAASGDAKAREWLGSYLAGKPTGNALRKLAATEFQAAKVGGDAVPGDGHLGDGHRVEVEAVGVEPAEPTAPGAHEESPAPGEERDVALDMEASLSPAQSVALAALVRGASATDAARSAGVSPGTVRRWLRSDPTFNAALNAALAEREARPRAALAALGQKAVDRLREALDGYGEPTELRAAVEVIKLLKLNEPAPSRATTPDAAERAIRQQVHNEMIAEALTPAPPSWRNGDGEDDEEDQ
jgi:hypothetical protein